MNEMKQVIAQRIQKYLQDNNLSQKQFLGVLQQHGLRVSQPGMHAWIVGQKEPRGEAKKILFDILGISVENTFHEVQVKKYPIMINNSYKDQKIDVNINPLEFIKCDYCMVYDKDDMKPLIENGDILFIKENETIQDGELVIIDIDNQQLVRRIFIKDNIYTLLSENNNAPPITLLSTDSKLSQLGIVKYIQKKV